MHSFPCYRGAESQTFEVSKTSKVSACRFHPAISLERAAAEGPACAGMTSKCGDQGCQRVDSGFPPARE